MNKQNLRKVRKAVIPCAGMGTRFLPWTKAVPKEMLPVVDKPVIQYVVEEAVASGIEQIIIVTSWHKKAIEDYFDHQTELEENLEKRGKTKALAEVKRIADMADFIYVRQKGPYGNATPVLSARHAVGDEPFAVLWGDQFVWAKPPRLRQVLDVFEKEDVAGVVAGMRVPPEALVSRGVCRMEPWQTGPASRFPPKKPDMRGPFLGVPQRESPVVPQKVFRLLEIIEKPKLEEAPSDMAAYGTYVFTPDIFPILEQLKPTKDGELWLVDAITKLARSQTVLVREISNGQFYDGGNKLAYHQAVVDFMLRDPEIGNKMREYLKEKVKS